MAKQKLSEIRHDFSINNGGGGLRGTRLKRILLYD